MSDRSRRACDKARGSIKVLQDGSPQTKRRPLHILLVAVRNDHGGPGEMRTPIRALLRDNTQPPIYFALHQREHITGGC
jgi:hypothetical protein